MLFSGTTTATALVAVSFLAQASLSAAGGHRHRARSHADLHAAKRATAGTVELPLGEIQMLQNEYTTFKFWINTWFNTTESESPAMSAAQLKQEFQAYDGWITAWLDSAMNNGQPPAPASLPALVPLPSASQSTAAASSGNAAASPSPVSLSQAHEKIAAVQAGATPTTTHTYDNGKYHWTQPASPSTSLPGSGSAPPPASVPGSGPSVPAAGPASPAASSPNTSAVAPSASSSPSTAPSTGGSGGSSSAGGSKNVAVYWGASAPSSQVPLSQVCGDSSVDIVILAFLTSFTTPTLAIGDCTAAPCTSLAKDIQTCQSAGKKVLLSLGGANAASSFSSDQQAQAFATTLWNTFGGGSGGSRPFGTVKIDGFDIDAENKDQVGITAFVTALRTAFAGDSSKQYYISAAPQCPRPDASIPLDAMQKMDYVWVQFYNNPECAVGSPGFQSSFNSWSSDLSANGGKAKLFIGAPASSSAAGSGFITAGQMSPLIAASKSSSNFGGVMLWDAAYAVQNGNYQQAMKSALG